MFIRHKICVPVLLAEQPKLRGIRKNLYQMG